MPWKKKGGKDSSLKGGRGGGCCWDKGRKGGGIKPRGQKESGPWGGGKSEERFFSREDKGVITVW